MPYIRINLKISMIIIKAYMSNMKFAESYKKCVNLI